MKRYVLIGLLLAGMGYTGYAQTDDIYATGRDQRGQSDTSAVSSNSRHYDNNGNQQGDNSGDNYQSYNNPDDYVDYDDDSYSSRINRFDNSFYNMGYYSTFYNPWWYNRYWVDPMWGYNPWYSGISISFGFGPYWSSGWGWNSWYGYGGFGCWNYPIYAGGWYGHYYGGYWNGYYAGLEGGRVYRSGYAAYGPRQTSIGNRVGYRTSAGNGFRMAGVNQMGLRSSTMAYANNRPTSVNGNGVSQRGGLFGRGQRSVQGNNGAVNQSSRGGLRSVFGGGNRNGGSRGNFFNGGSRSSGAAQGRQGGIFGGGGRSFGSGNGGGNVRSGGFGNGARQSGGNGAVRSGGFGGMRSSGGGGGRSSGGSRSSGGGRSSGGRR
jgi:hypothetical protein